MMLRLVESSPDAPDALALIDELSQRLRAITGSTGARNFTADSVRERGVFVVAYLNGEPCGCGAVRPLSTPGSMDVCEIKRMYSRVKGVGLGSSILRYLEQRAVRLDYREARLATRRVNTVAIDFYRRHGYQECENFGVYAGRPESICLGRRVP